MKTYSVKNLPNKAYRYHSDMKRIFAQLLEDNKVEKYFPTHRLPDNSKKLTSIKINYDFNEVISNAVDEHADDYYRDESAKHNADIFLLIALRLNAHEYTDRGVRMKRDIFIKAGNKKIKILSKNQEVREIAEAAMKTFGYTVPGFEFQNISLRFTSDPKELFTMSMRGIDSCMDWKSEHSCSLIGSIMDPYCSMISLTDGKKSKHGDNILARCIVRYVKNKKTPGILIEQVYLGNTITYNNNFDWDDDYGTCKDIKDAVVNVFKQYILEKTGIRKIQYNDDYVPTFSVPYSKIMDELSETYSPYSDCDVNRD